MGVKLNPKQAAAWLTFHEPNNEQKVGHKALFSKERAVCESEG